MGNFNNASVSRQVDLAPIYDHSTDRGSHIIAEIVRQLQGARLALTELGTGAKQIVANLSKEAAMVVSSKKGPYTITDGSTDTIKLKVNNGSSITVDMVSSTGSYTATQLADALNLDTTFAAVAEAFSTYDGRLAIRSLKTGITSQLEIENVANECYAVVGLTEAITKGDAKQWDAAKTTLETKVNDSIVEALKMVKLAANSVTNQKKDDLSSGLPIK